jgi:hypothetical protein
MQDERTMAALRTLASGGNWKGSFKKARTPEQIEQDKQKKLSGLHDKIIGQLPGHIKPELSPEYMNSKSRTGVNHRYQGGKTVVQSVCQSLNTD